MGVYMLHVSTGLRFEELQSGCEANTLIDENKAIFPYILGVVLLCLHVLNSAIQAGKYGPFHVLGTFCYCVENVP